MKGGIDKLSSQIAEITAGNIQMSYLCWDTAITSPIERLFAVGMISFIQTEELSYCMFSDSFLTDGQNKPPYFDSRSSVDGTVVIEFQKRELDWLADFVISAPSFSPRKIIVECDGHDFHERTKDQAMRDRSRDRDAQAAGYHMMRFTGAELYRDPLKCVRETLDILRRFIATP